MPVTPSLRRGATGPIPTYGVKRERGLGLSNPVSARTYPVRPASSLKRKPPCFPTSFNLQVTSLVMFNTKFF